MQQAVGDNPVDPMGVRYQKHAYSKHIVICIYWRGILAIRERWRYHRAGGEGWVVRMTRIIRMISATTIDGQGHHGCALRCHTPNHTNPTNPTILPTACKQIWEDAYNHQASLNCIQLSCFTIVPTRVFVPVLLVVIMRFLKSGHHGRYCSQSATRKLFRNQNPSQNPT